MKKNKKIFGVVVTIIFLISAIVVGLYLFRYNQKIKKEKSEEEKINRSFDSQREYIEEYFGIEDTDYTILSCDNQFESVEYCDTEIINDKEEVTFEAKIKVKRNMLDNLINDISRKGYSLGFGEICSKEVGNEDKIQKNVTTYSIMIRDYFEWMKDVKLKHSNIDFAQGFVSYNDSLEKNIEIELYYVEWTK